jgi:hypothetical protein
MQQPSLTTSMVLSLPNSIWNVPWVPPPLPDGPSYQMEGFTPAVFLAASRGTNSNPVRALNLQAASLDDLVDRLAAVIDDAGRCGDYSQVLSSERSFTL